MLRNFSRSRAVFSLKEVKRNHHNERLICENIELALNIFFRQDLLKNIWGD